MFDNSRDLLQEVQFFLKNGYIEESNEEKQERLEMEQEAREEDDYEA